MNTSKEYTEESIRALKSQGVVTEETLSVILKGLENGDYNEDFVAMLIAQMKEDWCDEVEAAESCQRQGSVRKHEENAKRIEEDFRSETFQELTGLDSELFITTLKEAVGYDKEENVD